jgi:hypothetical protein
MSNEDVGTTIGTATIEAETKKVRDEGEEEYEEEFNIEIRTQKGSAIKVESTSFNKLDELLDKAFNNYQRLAKEESGGVDEKLQYQ